MKEFLVKLETPQSVVEELHSFLKNDYSDEDLFNSTNIRSDLPKTTEWLLDCQRKVDDHRGVLINIPPKANLTEHIKTHHKVSLILGKILGKLLVQNNQGQRVIAVYDRDRLGSMWTGSRYHQTREGGTLHTDNVNVPEIWHYLILSCISPAMAGGENILVDGLKVHQTLKENYPEALAILEKDYVWEMRGVSDKLYNAPIITYGDNGEPHFRHLRPYMESAHQKAKKPMTEEQLYAIDVLDAVTNSSENQKRVRLESGDFLISIDDQVLHGRTCFSDNLDAISIEEYKDGETRPLKRTMERLWIQKQ